jgi:ribosome-binding protein aMBF1 (putative translation factor)
MKKLTEQQAIEIYRRALIGRTARSKGRAMSNAILADKMGMCKSSIARIGSGKTGYKRDTKSRTLEEAALIRAWVAEREVYMTEAALHTSPAIAADYGIHGRTVDAIYIGEYWPFIRRAG